MNPICEAYLYAASRAQTLPTVVQPAIDRGALVVADRSVFTSLTFQAQGRGLGKDVVREINRIAVGDLWPNKTVFIDLDPAVALPRTFDKSGDKFEAMGVDFFELVRKGYQELCTEFPQLIVRVDGSGTVDDVFERVVASIFGNNT